MTKVEVVCCCCFNNKDLFNMLESHQTFYDKVEVYASIIAECFEIHLRSSIDEHNKNLYMICKNCVFRLRNAVKLRSQVRKAYDRFQVQSVQITRGKKRGTCCCCCVSSEHLFNILEPLFRQKTENFSAIIAECFRIELDLNISESKKDIFLICENCVLRLRDALKLRSQVRKAYDRFEEKCDDNMSYDTDAVSDNVCLDKEKLERKNHTVHEESLMKDKLDFTTGEIFICDVCDMVFLIKAFLRRHMDIHQNDDAFACNACDEKFDNRNSLRSHTITHLNLNDMIEPRMVIEFCMTHRLIARECVCPKCNQNMKLNRKNSAIDKYAWQCRNKHEVVRTIRVGSIFKLSKLSTPAILKIIQLWCMNKTNERMMQSLNLAKESVTYWKGECRNVCKRICTEQYEMLGGPGIVVEITEAEYRMGARVIGGIERKSKKFFLVVVEMEISKKCLMDVIRKYVMPGSVVVGDSWKLYYCLSDEEYVEMKENGTYDFVDSEAAIHTENINIILSEMKQTLPRILRKKAFDSYAYEFMWKKNLERQGKDIFSSFLEALKDLDMSNIKEYQ